jgi:Spy/CpxP family protein refolding chaperone
VKVKRIALPISVAALLIAGLLTAGVAAADPQDNLPGPGGGYWGCPYYPGAPSGTLTLTADQQQKLADLQKKFIADNDKITDQMVDKQRQLRDLFMADTPNIKAIDKAQDDIRALVDKKTDLSRDFRNKARALLTDEQLKTDPFAFMMGPGFGGGFGPGFGRGFSGGWERGWDGHRGRGGFFSRWWGHHRW